MNKDMLFRRIYALKKMQGIIRGRIKEILSQYGIFDKRVFDYYGSYDDKACPRKATEEEKAEFKMLQYDFKKCAYAYDYLYWYILEDNDLVDEYEAYFKSDKALDIYLQNKDYKLTECDYADWLSMQEEKEGV